MTARWERLDEFLVLSGLGWFNSIALAQDLGVSRREASKLIQSYLDEQRRSGRTTYVLYRKGRTTGAVWHVGDRVADARALSRQWYDDVRLRVEKALEPDLIRIGISNPRAVQVTTAIANAVEANLQLLAAGIV